MISVLKAYNIFSDEKYIRKKSADFILKNLYKEKVLCTGTGW
jgi:hypothetical protein